LKKAYTLRFLLYHCDVLSRNVVRPDSSSVYARISKMLPDGGRNIRKRRGGCKDQL
jgi:hypothetical protein